MAQKDGHSGNILFRIGGSSVSSTNADVIKELHTPEEWLTAFLVMNELRTHLTPERYLELMHDMVKEGYRLFALYHEEEIVAVAGVIIRTNFYCHKHLFVYDLVTSSGKRSAGYGKKLLSFLHELARENGCEVVALDSGFHRVDAHRFYEEKMGYEKVSYSFRHKL